MKTIILVLSIVAVLLGALWLLQGLGLVQMEPILCFANCQPIEGPSATWAVAGLVLTLAGMFGITSWFKRRARHPS